MVKIIVTSPSGKSRFAYEFVEVDEAKKLLDVLRVHGFEAAQQYVQRIDDTVCKICGKAKSYHTPGRHPYRPFVNR